MLVKPRICKEICNFADNQHLTTDMKILTYNIHRCQDEFPARRGVKLYANHLQSKVFCGHLSRQRVEGRFYKLRDKERPKESAYVFNLIFRTPLKANEDWK